MEAVRHLGGKELPEAPWLTVEQVRDFERVSRMEVYRRMRPGDTHFLVSRDREDGQPGKLIDPRSMSFDARQRWRKRLLETADRPNPDSGPAQLGLLPRTEVDDQIDSLKLPRSERDVILRRFRIVNLFLNCNWKAQGYSSKSEFLKAIAKQSETSEQSIQRWVSAWKQREDMNDLADELPGPMPDDCPKQRCWRTPTSCTRTRCPWGSARRRSSKTSASVFLGGRSRR